MTSFVIEADGGSRGNPGPAGYGAVVMDAADGQTLLETAEAIGTATNNVAEYRGLIAGLAALLTLSGDGAVVEVRMDSKLVIEQMAGRWKIKNEGLRPLALEAASLARRLQVTWTWIPRERNRHADRLANEAMDAAAKNLPWHPSGAAPGTSPKGDRPAQDGPGRTRDGAGAASRGGDRTTAQDSASGVRVVSGEIGQASLFDEPDADTPVAAAATPGTGWRAPASSAMTLLLLRHGETPFSVERRFSGIGDPELTLNGVAQAEAAAARFKREPYEVDVIVTSPLRRARATAEIIAGRTRAKVVVDEGFRETDFGDWEGHTFTEIQRRWPDELAAWLADPDAAPPRGESFAVVAERLQETRERLLGEYTGKTVLVVSHVTPIKMLLRFALMAPPAALYRMHLDLSSLSVIEYYEDGPAVVKAVNDTGHLH
ncbi:bifunctional RNase H/acid phosphatase [Streptosporangium sp. KLBMP 9127]|nr:bifunctional RNase H/acid phosphatase [Streptosporangium sp. KLBMP 9127]